MRRVEPSGAAVRAGTFALGDSFLLGSTRVLTAAHVRVDAKVGRQFFEGIPELRAVARSGTLPRNLLVHLGTNGYIALSDCKAIVSAAGTGRPFLGVCVGMQLLATRGLEFGVTPGLGWIAGEVKRLETRDPSCKVPHMGWNGLTGLTGQPILAGMGEGTPMYFTHSFAFYPADEGDVAAWVDHGGRFPAAVARGNVAGVQFHPEKSQGAGLSLLARFLEWRP